MRIALVGALLAYTCIAACTRPGGEGVTVMSAAAPPVELRPFQPVLDGRWTGNGISYGPHRPGQTPHGGPQPTREQILEDLRLMAPRWQMLRMYGAGRSAETVLELIRSEKLPLRVMVGAWIAQEEHRGPDGAVLERFPAALAANQREVADAIRLANAYPDVVLAVSVGNETQVSWSSHRLPTDTLLGYIRAVRSATRVPVTTADDWSFWAAPESRRIAREIDFIVTHIYAMWYGRKLDEAMPFTQDRFAAVAAQHPDRVIVIGEAGWATRRHTEGEQAKLIAGEAGEPQQKIFHDQFIAWTTRERIANFFFEAFDEPWKGGAHPDEVEKHWGLFNADRTPKLALQVRQSRADVPATSPTGGRRYEGS